MTTRITDFPSTHAEEARAFDIAKSRCCPYYYAIPLEQCFNPTGCDCWFDAQMLALPAEERELHASDAALKRIASHENNS